MGESIDNRTVAALLRFTRGVGLELETSQHRDTNQHDHDANNASHIAANSAPTAGTPDSGLVHQAPYTTANTTLSTPDYRPPLTDETRPSELPIKLALVKAATEYAKYTTAA